MEKLNGGQRKLDGQSAQGANCTALVERHTAKSKGWRKKAPGDSWRRAAICGGDSSERHALACHMQNKSDDCPACATHPLAGDCSPGLSAVVLVMKLEHGALMERKRQERKRQVGIQQVGERTKQAGAIAVLLPRRKSGAQLRAGYAEPMVVPQRPLP